MIPEGKRRKSRQVGGERGQHGVGEGHAEGSQKSWALPLHNAWCGRHRRLQPGRLRCLREEVVPACSHSMEDGRSS